LPRFSSRRAQHLPGARVLNGCTSKIEVQAVGVAEEARIRTEFLDTGTVIEPVRVIKASVFEGWPPRRVFAPSLASPLG
jgi:hypothetical protein